MLLRSFVAALFLCLVPMLRVGTQGGDAPRRDPTKLAENARGVLAVLVKAADDNRRLPRGDAPRAPFRRRISRFL